MVSRLSNSKFLTVLDPVPLDGVGWYARVLSERDWASQIALVERFVGMGFTKEESGIGGGSITLDARDRLFTDPLPAGETHRVQDQEALWQIIEDGVIRAEFLAEDLQEDILTEDGALTTVISGRGTGSVLDWAKVLPDATATQREFYGYPMPTWLAMFTENQNKGFLPFVTRTFDVQVDSAGIRWDSVGSPQAFTLEAGESLLDLLNRFCDQGGYVWKMLPGFRLMILKDPGQNREMDVVFTLFRDQGLHQRLVDRRKIANVVYAASADGWAIASDQTSQDRWRKRMAWTTVSGDASVRSAVANATLQLLKDDRQSRTIQIDPGRPGRRLFTDFDVSDIVGVETTDGDPFSGSRKIVAISVDIDADGVVKPELTLESRFESRMIRQQKMLEALGGSSTEGAGSAMIPAGDVLKLQKIRDLIDVDLTGAQAGDVLVWDGAKVVDAGLNLNLLADVQLGAPADGHVLTYTAATGLWESKAPAAGSGGGGASTGGLLATVKYGSGTATGTGTAIGLLATAQFPELAFTLAAAATVQIEASFYIQTSAPLDLCYAVSADNFATYSVGDAYPVTPSGPLVAWPAGWVIQQQKTRPTGDTQYQTVSGGPLLLSLPAGTYKMRIYRRNATGFSVAEHGGFAMARKL